MERDMNLAREILLAVEKMPYSGIGRALQLPDRDSDVVNYHVMILADAGLIEAKMIGGHARGFVPVWQPKALTWAGHEFLDAARDEGRWEQAIATVRARTGGLALDVLKELLLHLAKSTVLGGP